MNTHGQLQGLAEAGGSNAEAINTCWWPMGGGGLGVMENSIKNNAVIFGNLPLAFYFFISKYISKKVSLL